jgi:hypothetical protein
VKELFEERRRDQSEALSAERRPRRGDGREVVKDLPVIKVLCPTC